jgi:hypothetical protein
MSIRSLFCFAFSYDQIRNSGRWMHSQEEKSMTEEEKKESLMKKNHILFHR